MADSKISGYVWTGPQSRRESCVFSFNHLILYTALHKRVLSTLQQCLLQFLTIINNNNNNNNNELY